MYARKSEILRRRSLCFCLVRNEASDGVFGSREIGVKRVGDGRIGQKNVGDWRKEMSGSKKMGEIVNYAREQGDWVK